MVCFVFICESFHKLVSGLTAVQNRVCYNSGPPPTLGATGLLLRLCEYCKTIHDLELGQVYLSNLSPFYSSEIGSK